MKTSKQKASRKAAPNAHATNARCKPQPPAVADTKAAADSVAPAADSAEVSPKANAPKATLCPLNEGQRLLTIAHGSLAEVAAAIGCSRQSVSDYRNGLKRPKSGARARLRDAFQIPVESWDQLPVGVSAPGARSAQGTRTFELPSVGRASTLDECLALLSVIRADRENPNLMAAERTKLADTETRLLALRHRIEKEELMLEDRIVREHPSWHRLRKVLLNALSKHPLAAKDVLEAIRASGFET